MSDERLTITAAEHEVAVVRACVDRLRDALARYGQHEAGCGHLRAHEQRVYLDKGRHDLALEAEAACAADPALIRACCTCDFAKAMEGA